MSININAIVCLKFFPRLISLFINEKKIFLLLQERLLHSPDVFFSLTVMARASAQTGESLKFFQAGRGCGSQPFMNFMIL